MLYLVDLEHDHVNPFEATRFINRLKVPELGLHVFHLLCVGYVEARILFLWQFLFVLYQSWNFYQGRMYVDVTSIFKDLSAEKKKTGIRLGVYFAACVWTVFTLVHTAVGK